MKMEDNQSPYLTLLESTAPGTPASTLGKLYVKTDGILYFKNDAGTETSLIAGAAAIPPTIFDAKGDIIVASAADTAARMAAGADYTVPRWRAAATNGLEAVFPPGYEFDYVQITSPVSVTATVEATPNNIVVGSAVTYDGSTIIQIEFYAPNCRPDAGAAQRLFFLFLYDGTTSLGYMALLRNDAADDQDVPVHVIRRLTPSAASHTYKVAGIVDAGTGVVNVGAGGVGNAMPGFIRITKV